MKEVFNHNEQKCIAIKPIIQQCFFPRIIYDNPNINWVDTDPLKDQFTNIYLMN